MPMQELVVPVFGGRALLNEMKPLCVVGGRSVPPRGHVSLRVALLAPEAQMRALNYDQVPDPL